MKLQNLGIIFIIIIMPIILIVSYYISLQIDTVNMQTSYNTKLLESTKEAIESFEINTVEWNNAYSETADSKRRDIMASINTFTSSFANSIGMGGASKETILSYVPAIAYTLYDGYYIYSPAETKEVIKDENGVTVFVKQNLVNYGSNSGRPINFERYDSSNEGKILYKYDSQKGGSKDGTYTYKIDNKEETVYFTLDPSKAKITYSHILKPFTAYSARYVNGNTDITVNYTLDNYITVYGKVGNNYEKRAGYLINTNNDAITMPKDTCNGIKLNNKIEIKPETLTEKIAWREDDKSDYTEGTYTYVYEAENNTKVYFDHNNDNKAFQINSLGIRTYLEALSSVKYKKLSIYNGEEDYCIEIYQALNSGEDKDGNQITAGNWYIEKNKGKGTPDPKYGQADIGLTNDVSAINYYTESYAFSKWVEKNLSNIKVGDMQNKDKITISEDEQGNTYIFKNAEDEKSLFNLHKREVIKQSVISNLNQAITGYSRNSEGNFYLPVLSETDWDQILTNVSIITFVQNIPIGMKYYNNYAIATSTSNKEYVDPDEIYLSTSDDKYYHLPYCKHLTSTDGLIGYRSIDYKVKSYEKKNETTEETTPYYYYKHNNNINNEECYYCLVQRSSYNKTEDEDKKTAYETAYETALAREKYAARKIDVNIEQVIEKRPDVNIQITPYNINGYEIKRVYNGKYVTTTNPKANKTDQYGGTVITINTDNWDYYTYQYRINGGNPHTINYNEETTEISLNRLENKSNENIITVHALRNGVEEKTIKVEKTIVIDNEGPKIEKVWRETEKDAFGIFNDWYIHTSVEDEFSQLKDKPKISFDILKNIEMTEVEDKHYKYRTGKRIGDSIEGTITATDVFENITEVDYEFKANSNNIATITIKGN